MNRSYEGPSSIGREYDAWTADGVLERYWGEHIHHGYYTNGKWSQHDFKEAKIELLRQLLNWSEVSNPNSVLDIGCGIGGSARYLAKKFGSEVTGVTLSEAQIRRAKELTDPSLPVRFQKADALHLPFPDAHFDFVWSCESGEHMPDKHAFLSEMIRVLRPRGRLLMATWCHRAEPPLLSSAEKKRLRRIYRGWALPYFIPIESYAEKATADGRLEDIRTADWSRFVSPTWPHQIGLGLKDIFWLLGQGPKVIRRSIDDAWRVRDMIIGFKRGTIRYGLLSAIRKNT